MLQFVKNNIVQIAFVIGLLLPQTLIAFFLQAILLLLVLLIKKGKGINNLALLVVICIIVSFVFNLNENFTLKNSFRIIFLIFLFLMFPICKYEKISNITIYLAFGFILFSQFLIAYRIPGAIQFFDSFYPVTGDIFTSEYSKKLSSVADLAYSRYAGLYRNPNICSEFVSLLFLVFIAENINKPLKNNLLAIFIFFISLFLSGSRTGLLTFIIGATIYLYHSYKNRKAILFLVIIIFGIFYIYLNTLAEFRVFNISGGMDKEASFGIKYNIFISYLQNPKLHFQNYLFGHFTFDNIAQYGFGMFDSGVGNFFFSFGFIGLACLLLFYIQIFRLKDAKITLLMAVNLFAITSGVLMVYRMSFLFILLLSNYYSLYLTKKTQ